MNLNLLNAIEGAGKRVDTTGKEKSAGPSWGQILASLVDTWILFDIQIFFRVCNNLKMR